jgi:hypothetical protein
MNELIIIQITLKSWSQNLAMKEASQAVQV